MKKPAKSNTAPAIRNICCTALAVLLLAFAIDTACAQSNPTPTPERKSAASKQTITVRPMLRVDPAERAFQENCNRCHNAPESLSPSVTGTVMRQMRVHANLSAEDERLILRYFNP